MLMLEGQERIPQCSPSPSGTPKRVRGTTPRLRRSVVCSIGTASHPRPVAERPPTPTTEAPQRDAEAHGERQTETMP
jgi:hypothetical protein